MRALSLLNHSKGYYYPLITLSPGAGRGVGVRLAFFPAAVAVVTPNVAPKVLLKFGFRGKHAEAVRVFVNVLH